MTETPEMSHAGREFIDSYTLESIADDGPADCASTYALAGFAVPRGPVEYPDPATVKLSLAMAGDEIAIERTTRKPRGDDRPRDLAVLILSAAESLAAALGADVAQQMSMYMGGVRRIMAQERTP